MEVRDAPGALYEVLRFFWKHDVNITRIESRPTPRDETSFNFFVDFNGRRGDPNVDQLLVALKEHTERIYVLDDMEVPWFPRHVSDLDHIADSQCFNDEEYRRRRDVLAQSALRHRHGKALPHIDYSHAEVETWGHVWDKRFWDKAIMRDLSKQIGYSRGRIPQQEDVSAFLQDRTGFSLRPVAGLLSSRDFLNALAFRVFFCTQYIRHHSMPLYTPEPDICHELLGHAPMFADPEFADFSQCVQEFGLASLGASDEEITRLARVYWFSVEFGLCRQQGELKAYGAGLLSSFGELEPEYLPWEPAVAAKTEFPITCYQLRYFVADSLADAKHKMRYYCQTLAKPFHARYNPISQSIWVDRAVATQSRE
ncbi:simliar to phenylalanine-4-hydroxylase [Tribonema minus]|uniref:phenylalanine 4-monooxygenase n=1 Tax=Tribonema minus TaxID=303371 RepID=A0A836CCP3_9STRA|nr:simliar to phenylalanine-4-hydroxylase [Tribonema minus]